jgi:16S rRNA (uracil1498-N3)-methyltransferase
MALHFLVDDVPLDAPVGAEIVITGAEAHHAAAVRRVRVGEEVTVGDGRGLWLEAVVTDVAPKRVVAAVTARTSHPAAAPRLVLVQALAKGDRDELAIQAATELGVDEIVPWQAARSVSRWDQTKAAKGVARWQTIVREAAKQAHRAWVPVVSAPVSTAQLAARAASRMLVLEPTASVPLSGVALAPDDARDLVLVVGPEGGIAPEELVALADAGATAARLGTTVLRTSTAALAVLNARLGRW